MLDIFIKLKIESKISELLEKYKAISTKIEDAKNIKFNALPVNDVRYIKAKIGTYGDKVYN